MRMRGIIVQVLTFNKLNFLFCLKLKPYLFCELFNPIYSYYISIDYHRCCYIFLTYFWKTPFFRSSRINKYRALRVNSTFLQVHGGFSIGKRRPQSQGLAENAPRFSPGHPMFRRRNTVLLLVRMDNQGNWPRQLHGSGAGSHGREDVPVHGRLESGVDHSDRTVERSVVRTGFRGEDVVREKLIAAGRQ